MTAEDLEDLFRPLGHVTIKRVFSGRGVSLDGATFALEFRGVVYLKAIGEEAAALEAVGSQSFTYERNGREVSVGYWTLPESAFDDPDELRRWALPALDFARQRKAAKPAKSGKRKPARPNRLP